MRSLILISVLSLIGSAVAVEFIEFNDHNNDLLPLDISRPFWYVQGSLQKNYQFERVRDAVKFINDCKSLNENLAKEEDGKFEGLVGKMKAVLAEPELVKLCATEPTELDLFKLLDAKDIGVSLSKKRMNAMVELGKNLEAHPNAKQMLSYLFEKIKSTMTTSLLNTAAQDTTTFFGDRKRESLLNLSVGENYNAGCSIPSLKQICKLVRKTNNDDVSALAWDVATFAKALQANDQEVLKEHSLNSGVGLDDLKETCKATRGNWHVMRVVDAYLEAGFLTEAQVEEQSKVEANFALYRELHKLCKLATAN